MADLSHWAKTVLALEQVGVTEPERVGWFLNAKPQDTAEFAAKLRRSRSRVVRRVRRHGLPKGLYVPLYPGRTVACPMCGAQITWVPCVKCSQVHTGRERFVDPPGPPPAPQRPTSAAPGSLQKIRVFRARLARGEAMFHPRDVTSCNQDTLSP